jgi:drug/metabolite transporter (DMT)-like permease
MLLGGALLFVFGLSFEHASLARALTPASIGSILYLAAGGSVLAYFFNHWLLQRVDSGTVGLSALMIPVVAVTVGVLFGGESLRVVDFVGAALVLVGSWLALARNGLSRAGVARLE